MNELKIEKYSLHKFNDRESIKFSPTDYSKLKYGSGKIGYNMGVELAKDFFSNYYDILVTKDIVVTESSYQSLKNAASMITDGFICQLNIMLSEMNGNFIKRIKVSRNAPYIQDYGKVSLQQRVKLLEQDTFTLDHEFVKNKFIIFIDDILITGTHQRKIEEMCSMYNIDFKECLCVYYAELLNPYEDPSIEAYLNTYEIKTLSDLTKLINEDPSYTVIVRTVKMFLSWENYTDAKTFIALLKPEVLVQIYLNSLNEGYYKNPAFSKNFSLLRESFNKITI